MEKFKFSDSAYQPHLAFWRGQLQRCEASAQLIQQPSLRAGNGQAWTTREYSLSMEARATLKNMTGENQYAQFVVLFAAINLLLRKYLSQNATSITFTPTLGLEIAEEPARVLPFIVAVDDEWSLKKFMRECQSILNQGYSFQDFPWELASGDVPRDYRGLSNILVTCDGLHQPQNDLEFFDLVIRLKPATLKKEIVLEFRSSLFEDWFMNQFAGHLDHIVCRLNDLDGQLNDVQLPVRHEKIASVDPEIETTLKGAFESQVRKCPDAIAVGFKDTVLSYQELNRWADQLAGYIAEKYSLKGETIVGVMMEKTPYMIISILAILKAGGAYMPIDPRWPARRKQQVIEDAQPSLVMVTSEYTFDLTTYTGTLMAVDLELTTVEGHERPSISLRPGQSAYVIFTSGSTGTPKGVIVEHQGVVNMVMQQIRIFGMTSSDKVLFFASLAFDASVSEIFTALLAGGTLLIPPQAEMNDPQVLRSTIRNERVNVITLPPSYLSVLHATDLPNIRVLISAGESPNPSKVKEFSHIPHYFNAYGPTECSVCVSAHEIVAADLQRMLPPVGKALPNLSINISDTRMNPLPDGVKGEIWVGGIGVARGYLNRPELTAERFHVDFLGERFFNTGDIGLSDLAGIITVLGRSDGQLKIRGFRIEPGEVDAVLGRYPDIISVKTVGLTAPNGQRCLCSYFVSHSEISTASLAAFLGEYLPQYYIPEYFIRVHKFTSTTAGKIDSVELPSPFTELLNDNLEGTDDIERGLLKIWTTILAKGNIGVNDNFFHLGGHSLKAAQLCIETYKVFKVEINVADIFNLLTVRRIADYVRGTLTSADGHIDDANAEVEYEL